MSELNTKLFLLQFFLMLTLPKCLCCLETDSINSSLILKDPETIRSAAKHFTLGFFSPNASTIRYLGIWYTVSPAAITWVANREAPLPDARGSLSLSPEGNLVIRDGARRVVWSSDAPPTSMAAIAQLLDSGNLVLRDAAAPVWESHKHPVDSFMPTMRLSHNPRTGARVALNSWRAASDPGRGNFTLGLHAVGVPQAFIWRDGAPVWRSGPWNGRAMIGVTRMYSYYVDGFSLSTDEDGTYYITMNSRHTSMARYNLNVEGVVVEGIWDEARTEWSVRWSGPANDCDYYNKCGPFASCFVKDKPICSCLKGYEPREKREWERADWKGGCVRREKLQLQCDKKRGDGFSKMSFIKVPDFMQWTSGLQSDCPSFCLRNCSCLAYAYDPGIGCMFWSGDLIDVQKFDGDGGIDFYVRVAYSEIEKEKTHKRVLLILAVVFTSVAASICLFLLAWWACKQKGTNGSSGYAKGEGLCDFSSEMELPNGIDKAKIEEVPLYKFAMLANATNSFDMNNRLGVGGFGPVYKGKLGNGDEIAVKRLSRASGQGYEEFMNEVLVISKLQHRNLVRLLGCCVERGEKMLIYEHVPNRSLDFYLFDKKQDVLDWKRRFQIMQGIGRGLLYLHRDSRLKIIHRDLKPSNVLLDGEWNPKISDFGMARIFGGNQDQAATAKIVGTYGYMAPEYVMGGRISEKTDVFSFGVLVLEIISGRRNTSFYNDEMALGLLGYAWKLWNEDNIEEMIDERIYDPDIRAEVMRCFHIGLLCVQESPMHRPTISIVLSMLSTEIAELQLPEPPGFTEWRSRSQAASTSSTQTPSSNYITHTALEGR